MEKNRWFQALVVLLVIVAAWHIAGQAWALGERFSDIILIFFLAWLLAFVLGPIAQLLHRVGLPRLLAVFVIYLSLLLFILVGGFLLVPLITIQLNQISISVAELGEQLPGWLVAFQEELLNRNINVDLSGFYSGVDLPAQLAQAGSFLLQNAFGILSGFASAMFQLFLVLVISFYMMVDGSRFVGQMVTLVPRGVRSETAFFFQSVERTFGGFLLGQLAQCVIYGAGTAAVMVAGGLPFVLLTSIVAGISMLIPFVGPMLAIIPPVFIAALQESWTKAIFVGGALLVLQQILLNVIAPKILSEAVGLPPLLVILALLVGAKLAGLVGALFGVPVAAVIYATLVYAYRRSAHLEMIVPAKAGGPDGPRAIQNEAEAPPPAAGAGQEGDIERSRPLQWLIKLANKIRGRG